MASVSIEIDGRSVEAPLGASLLAAARAAGLYIPALCSHPDLPSGCGSDWEGCGLCVVEVAGRSALQHACVTPVAAGMSVTTSGIAAKQHRQKRIADLLANHPHVCLTCPQRDGCSRTTCSFGNPPEQRCCSLFENCELRKLCDYIEIPPTTRPYKTAQLPVVKDEPFYDRDYNLCIDCRRCLVACNEVRGVGCLEVKQTDGRSWVGTVRPNLIESGCKFCSACVTVCPTGALIDRRSTSARQSDLAAPCQSACPAGIDVPRYVQLVGLGRYAEATAVVREKLPFPGILGRACFSPCESSCRRKDLDDPLSIRSLKRIAADRDTGLWRAQSKQLPDTGRKVAIIGAGPAGLTAAYYLAKQGHSVTVFEALPDAGGMARYGIPAYRLPAQVLDNEIAEVAKLGVEFCCGTRIEDADALFAQGFEAVFVAIGAHYGDRLGVPGDDLPNVLDSPSFLRAATQGKIGNAIGKRVAVIGGGNVATDVCRSAKRLGAEVVELIYRRSRDEMPARAEEVQGCIDEGINLRFLIAPKKIELGNNGSRLKVTYVKMQLSAAGEDGRRRPVEIDGSEFSEPVDLVVASIGQHTELPPAFALTAGRGGRITVREDNLATSRPAVFAGGDCVLGPATLIEAVAHGRRAAASIDQLLGGDGDIDEQLLAENWATDPRIGPDKGFNCQSRLHPTMLPQGKRSNWHEVDLGFDTSSAQTEALRCLKCNLATNMSEPVLPPEAWREFNAVEIEAIAAEPGVYQLLDSEKNVLSIKGAEDLRAALAALLGGNHAARFFVVESAPFFSQRENQLMQAYMQAHGQMPSGLGVDELDELF